MGPPDWPCVQRLIPNLSAGAIWSGPPIDQLEASWWSDDEIARVARFASARATPVEDAVERHIAAGNPPVAVIEDYVGHGIGSAMHQPPDVLNYRTGRRGPRLRPGMCLAVEPMLTRGGLETRVLADDWTVVTTDASRAAHWEHTVAITETGISVLTSHDGGTQELETRNVAAVSLS